MNPKKVFISYSHDSPEHSQWVRRLADALRGQGVDAELDQYHVRPAPGWPRWCEEQLKPENADFVLVICTRTYLRRVENKTAADEGRGVFWEGWIIYHYLYNEKGNQRFIPVLPPGAAKADIPLPLRDGTAYRPGAFDLDDPAYRTLYRELTGQPAVTKPPLGRAVSLPSDGPDSVNPLPPLAAREAVSAFTPIDISRIDKYAPANLIGREEEMALLNDAWDQAVQGAPGRPRIVTFVAMGGEGKTSLVSKWAAELAHKNWPGCEAALAWSFYSQGAREHAGASSDTFFKEALTFFGDPKMADSAADGLEKGRRLAQLAGERRALLILDGLEPLQYPPGSPMAGHLQDQGLALLLKNLAAASQGLCVVTTRYSIPDLRAHRQTGAPERELKRLSTNGGVALLKDLGVCTGSREDFETLVEEVDGHALTLQIMGGFLKKAYGGDIRRRDRLKFERADAEVQGGHAFRAMAAYETWLQDQGDAARRDLAILRLMGLFDRPATADCLHALMAEPPIPELTEPLVGIAEEELNLGLDALESARLLTVHQDGAGSLLGLDAHPLLREYFAGRLGKDHRDAFCTAHRRLFEHLCNTTKEGEQPDLETLQPLYQAVAHGCRAGLQQAACDKVYFGRILRGKEVYSIHKLGAIGSDLGAVACFFEIPWRRVAPGLTSADQAWMIGQAAFRLRALGRLAEALEPMRAGLEMSVQQENWQNAARGAGNLSELELTLGEVAGAVADGEQSVAFADRSGDAPQRMINRTTHADALHQAGRRAEALALFREAEQMQAGLQPEAPLLYSLRGFLYCDLLLAGAEREAGRLGGRGDRRELSAACRKVSQRAAQTLEWVERANWLLDIALDHLTLGRAALFGALLERAGFRHPGSELAHIDNAVAGLRRSGVQDHLPRGLLTRAWLRSLTSHFTGLESAQSDLDEAWEIAERGPMPLFMADIHLYRARLFFRQAAYPWESPRADLAEARRLVEKHGYWRRREELEDAEAVILQCA